MVIGKLKNIAVAMVESFTSRTNDLDGYWALGILRKEADGHELIFDLLNKEVNLNYSGAGELADYWSNELERHINLNRFSKAEAIKAASITLMFQDDLTCTCIFDIKTKMGKEYRMESQFPCWPHNPDRESRRFKELWNVRSNR
jgi:hypothetical protein